jgi:hypothetical protein
MKDPSGVPYAKAVLLFFPEAGVTAPFAWGKGPVADLIGGYYHWTIPASMKGSSYRVYYARVKDLTAPAGSIADAFMVGSEFDGEHFWTENEPDLAPASRMFVTDGEFPYLKGHKPGYNCQFAVIESGIVPAGGDYCPRGPTAPSSCK